MAFDAASGNGRSVKPALPAAEGRALAAVPLPAGHFLTTGACVAPTLVLPGRQVEADFGWIGRIGAHCIQGDTA